MPSRKAPPHSHDVPCVFHWNRKAVTLTASPFQCLDFIRGIVLFQCMKDSQHVLSVHILSKFIVIWYWPILHIFSAVSLALSESYHYPTACASVINLPSQNKAQIACKCPSVMGYVIYTLGGPWHLLVFCFIFFITPSSYCFLAGTSRYFYIVFGALFGKRKTATCMRYLICAGTFGPHFAIRSLHNIACR